MTNDGWTTAGDSGTTNYGGTTAGDGGTTNDSGTTAGDGGTTTDNCGDGRATRDESHATTGVCS